MLTAIVLMGTYLWSAFLMQYFFSKTLGEKYSSNITFWGTITMWIVQCVIKLFPMLIWGAGVVVYSNILLMIISVIYVAVLYKRILGIQVLAFVILYIVQGIMDMIGMNITGIFFGSYELMDMNSNYTIIVAFVSLPFITLGTVCLEKVWKLIEKINWKKGNYQWLCLILPVSQYVVMWRIAVRYSVQFQAVPLWVIMGTILALLADAYMVLLFYRLNRRDRAEKELEGLNHQYELEQVRYEQLKKSQEETAKIRHDFQNYILTLKRME